ncbi:hypothetical protein BN903_103 [Halorubrum sp. AJ67]|nr:hypothetical protein BN903_103 [Halorubrum sp. AJ67]
MRSSSSVRLSILDPTVEVAGRRSVAHHSMTRCDSTRRM